MGVNMRNSEGYYDPTTYRAFKNIDKDEKRKARFRPLVYICSPYAGGNKEKNIANAQRYCRFAVDSGCLPLAPHLYFPQFMDDSELHTDRIRICISRYGINQKHYRTDFRQRYRQRKRG